MNRNHKQYWAVPAAVLGIACLVSCGLYLVVSSRGAGIGFPLDDAWIHQTFARNFGTSLVWSFQKGQVSGGSTGPAWGLLLAPLYALSVNPIWGTHLLGWVLLWGCCLAAFFMTRIFLPGREKAAVLAGLCLALEWHLAWAALSGMETALFMLVGLCVFLLLVWERSPFWLVGLLVGFSVWIRPDGLTLAGPALAVIACKPVSLNRKFVYLGQFFGCALVLLGPYFLFNEAVAGAYWPNTFFAKQAEYALLREGFYLARYAQVGLQVITGVGAVLLPGFIKGGLDAVKSRDWTRMSLLAWVIGYIGVYAWRLPVIYQHGRYIMPVMPIYFILGIVGWVKMLPQGGQTLWQRIGPRSVLLASALVLVLFLGLGARAYARDVEVIQTQMVDTALWVKQNTSPAAVIGAHDIGALGYFGDRAILDLAGLVSPDVIDFIRDESQLANYLDAQGAEYLITFPSWYPDLVQGREVLYRASGAALDEMNSDVMTVYRWK